MPPSRLFLFDQSVEQLKHPWNSQNAFTVLAKSLTNDEILFKIQERWSVMPLLCQRQVVMMIASELEADCSLKSRMQELTSLALMSDNGDDWLRYLLSSSRNVPPMNMSDLNHQPLFHQLIEIPERTRLPDESVTTSSNALSRNVVVEDVAHVSKAAHIVAKQSRPPIAVAAAMLTSSKNSTEASYKPKNIAELVEFDPEEPDVRKGPQKRKRCR